ncbi:MAG: energy transducer TonB [Melioribacter sp.]|nr:energy transducer TonB [Melioribacter sp.]
MKTLKNIFLFVVAVLIISSNVISAQDKNDLDKQPFPIGGMESILKNIKYPDEGKKDKIEGNVFVRANINENGVVTDMKIEEGNNKLLIDAALNAVKATKFTPGEIKGKKVKAEVVVPILFKLS